MFIYHHKKDEKNVFNGIVRIFIVLLYSDKKKKSKIQNLIIFSKIVSF